MAPEEGHGAELIGELRECMQAHNVFRGQMISLESTMWGEVRVAFHERPALRRDDVVLPEDLLDDIERHTLGIGRRAEALRAADQHLKRGLLLHGPPGTGKTHTVKWLAAELATSTVIVLAGGSLGVAGPVCDDPEPPATAFSEEPEDDYLIVLSRAASVAALVSGDAHLTRLAPAMPVLTPAAFLHLLASG